MENQLYEEKILQIWFSGVNDMETNTKQKNMYGEI